MVRQFSLCILGGVVLMSCALPMQTELAQNVLNQDGQAISSDSISDFIIQQLNEKRDDKKQIKKNKKQADWYAKKRNSGQKTPELNITDVRLKDTGESILREKSEATLQPDYAGTRIHLMIQGTFEKKKRPLEASDFAFTYEPPLIQQTFLGKQPKARVLLDHSILLEVIAVNDNEIEAVLNTQYVPDLYLKGPHHFSVEYGNYYVDTFVDVGEPAPVNNLLPQLDAAELVFTEDQHPGLILLKGKNMMVFPKFSYAMVDDQFVFGYQTEVFSDGTSETTIHIPDPENFNPDIEHTITYATPFGTSFVSLGGINP